MMAVEDLEATDSLEKKAEESKPVRCVQKRMPLPQGPAAAAVAWSTAPRPVVCWELGIATGIEGNNSLAS